MSIDALLYNMRDTFKAIGIRSTISMLESERRQHSLKVIELEHDGSRNACNVKNACNTYIEYCTVEIERLEKEYKELKYDL